MPLKSGFRNVQAQIEEIKLKISLLEDDKRAYHENAEQTIRDNKDRILLLRRENKIKRQEIARNSADGEMIEKSLQKLPTELKFLSKHSATIAIETLDEKTCDLIKTLNILKYERKNREKELKNLLKRNETLNDNQFELIANSSPDIVNNGYNLTSNSSSSNNNNNSYKYLELENQLDKTRMKCREAEQIQHTYHLIRSKLEDEQQSLPALLDEVEAGIKRLQSQLKQLKSLEKDAKVTLESTKSEFDKKEKKFLADKKARDSELTRVKKDVDEKKNQNMAVQQRIKNRGNSSLEKSPNGDLLTMAEAEQNIEKIKSYEEAFSLIKRATGISDTKELVKRFKTQQYRKDQLNEMREKNDATLELLTDEKLKTQHEFQQLEFKKSSTPTDRKLYKNEDDNIFANELAQFDSKITNDSEIMTNRDLNSSEKNDDDEAQKREILMKLEKGSNLLTQLKTGVEHLHEKLKPFKIPPSAKRADTTGSESYRKKEIGMDMMMKLNECQTKLTHLCEKERKIAQLMMTSEVADVAPEEKKIPLSADDKSQKSTDDVVAKNIDAEEDDDNDLASNNDDDDGSVLTRIDMKKLSQQIIENKTKRRQVKRKKNK